MSKTPNKVPYSIRSQFSVFVRVATGFPLQAREKRRGVREFLVSLCRVRWGECLEGNWCPCLSNTDLKIREEYTYPFKNFVFLIKLDFSDKIREIHEN